MAEGITGWRLHVGVIFPTPVPPRAVLEFYEAVPEGVDMTTVSLTIQQLSDSDMDEAIKGMERAAKQLANFDVDVIYQSGVPPVVAIVCVSPVFVAFAEYALTFWLCMRSVVWIWMS